MELKTAQRLANDLERISDVSSSQVVHFKDRGDATFDKTIDNMEDLPKDDLYGVHYYAHDMYIPKAVIDTVSKYDSGGIITRPEPGVVTPSQ